MNSIKINYIVLLVTFILVITMKSIICGKGDEVKDERVEALEITKNKESEPSDNYNLAYVLNLEKLTTSILNYGQKVFIQCYEELQSVGFEVAYRDNGLNALVLAFNNLSEDIVDMSAVSVKIYFEHIFIKLLSCYTSSIGGIPEDVIHLSSDINPNSCLDNNPNSCLDNLKKSGINKNAHTISIIRHMYLNMTKKIAESRGHMFKKYFVDTSAILFQQCAKHVPGPDEFCAGEEYRTRLGYYLKRHNDRPISDD